MMKRRGDTRGCVKVSPRTDAAWVVSTMILKRISCLESVDHSIYPVGRRTLATILKRLVSFRYKCTEYSAADQTSLLPHKHRWPNKVPSVSVALDAERGECRIRFDHKSYSYHVTICRRPKIRLEGPVRWKAVEGQAREGVS